MAKTRYIKQRDQYRCGPVAVINTLKFLGVSITYKSLPIIQELCKCANPHGTDRYDFENALKKLGVKFERRVRPTLKDIDRHINKGGAILMDYYLGYEDGHYALCIGRKDKENYLLVNSDEGPTVAECHRTVYKYMSEWCCLDQEPWCWFVFPEEINEQRIARYCYPNQNIA